MQSAHKPPIVIHAGELVFGKGRRRIKTLLGSCVAITLWHPRHKYGGMCHFALARKPATETAKGKTDARYADDCMRLFRKLAEERGTRLSEYKANIYGGGNMLASARLAPDSEFVEVDRSPVGDSNAAQAFALLVAEGVSINEADVGEQGYRKVDFDPMTGQAKVEFVPIANNKI
ncbi:chemotaxis protein CheD [Vreelandella venusta]|uniref:chemotaxis protein CheD n=1 Tax=Vreelandella venusta TaxID=44935 RepID=UPI00384F45A2